MTDLLRRLLETHEFCRRALARHRHSLDTASVRKLEHDRDQAFFKLVTHVSANPNVTVAQIDLLISGLAQLSEERTKAEQLRQLCSEAVARLAPGSRDKSRLEDAVAAPAAVPAPQLRQALDTLPERAAIFDRDYRYVYANPANAGFHEMSVADMEKLPIWRVIGTRAFETVSRQQLDRCLQGEAVTIITRRFGHRLFWSHFAPLRSECSRHTSAFVTVREIPRLETTDAVIWDVPEPDA